MEVDQGDTPGASGSQGDEIAPEDLPTVPSPPGEVSSVVDGRLNWVLRNEEKEGDQIGQFTLLEKLGEGGFGTVWKAEQREPLVRQVALKVLKMGLETGEIRARFQREQQLLAVLEHPNIAKIFDAGTTGSGRPFFTMEIVDGVPITKYCREHRLGLRGRIELFIPVCQAVQHAHSKQLIHRDLKPSNVLVSVVEGKGVAKVIDFGIAKALERRTEGDALMTIEGTVIGTPQYMSPEQIRGVTDTDTRSDVYSLGVMLYQLLTGSTPLDPKATRSASPAELERLVCDFVPPTPSKRAGSGAGGEASFGKLLRGDLDWIVMRSLEKDRERRYRTADELGAELQRFLDDEPVTAGSPSAVYRLKKFVRRHRVPVAAAAVSAAALVSGAAASIFYGLEAAKARDEEVVQHLKSLDSVIDLALQRGDWKLAIETIGTARRSGHPEKFGLSLDEIIATEGLSEPVDGLVEALRSMDVPEERGGEWEIILADRALLAGDRAGAAIHLERASQWPLAPSDRAIVEVYKAEDIAAATSAAREAARLRPWSLRANYLACLFSLFSGKGKEAAGQIQVFRTYFPSATAPDLLHLLDLVHRREDAEYRAVLASVSGRLGPGEADMIDAYAAVVGWVYKSLVDIPAYRSENPGPLEKLGVMVKLNKVIAASGRGEIGLAGPALPPLPPLLVEPLASPLRAAALFDKGDREGALELLVDSFEKTSDGFNLYLQALIQIELKDPRRAAELFRESRGYPYVYPAAKPVSYLMEGMCEMMSFVGGDDGAGRRALDAFSRADDEGQMGHPEHVKIASRIARRSGDLFLAEYWARKLPVEGGEFQQLMSEIEAAGRDAVAGSDD